jgi:hypothetical protein
MKKVVKRAILITLILIIFTAIFASYSYAAVEQVKTDNTVTGQLIELRDTELKSLDDYKAAYGSDTYGLTAYLLNKVRIFSIPLFFVVIIIAGTYKYVIGIRKLDNRDKGYGLMISSVTVLVICQLLPLIFTIVVNGWRG